MKKKIGIKIHLDPIDYNYFKKEALEQNRTIKNLIETLVGNKIEKDKQ